MTGAHQQAQRKWWRSGEAIPAPSWAHNPGQAEQAFRRLGALSPVYAERGQPGTVATALTGRPRSLTAARAQRQER